MTRAGTTSDAGAGRWRLDSSHVIICLAGIALADLLIWRWLAPHTVEGLLDEPAHAATGLLGLAALTVWFDLPMLIAVLAGSLLIDLDHVPQMLGSEIIQHGVPRPYTHSLLTLAVVLVAALLLHGRARELTLLVGFALALHFLRDLAEPGGQGISLLWPFSDAATVVGYGWYAAAMLAMAAVALVRRQRDHNHGVELRRGW